MGYIDTVAHSTRKRPYGAYGLRLYGLDFEALIELPTGLAWPGVRVHREVGPPSYEPQRVDTEAANVPLIDGDRALIRRHDRSARLFTSEPTDDGRMLHPFLTAIAVVFAWWDGRHAFHGGAFVGADGAWCLFGGGAEGKSSTLGRISLCGVPVLSDDLIVSSRGQVFAGPRCIDLRHDAAEALGVSSQASPVRGGERLRLGLPPALAEVPLRGLLFLTWGATIELRPVRPTERLLRLSQYRSTATLRSPRLLDLAATPAWEIQRPPRWGSLEPAVERLLDLARA
jgi:hypothetical protein